MFNDNKKILNQSQIVPKNWIQRSQLKYLILIDVLIYFVG